MQLGHRVKAEHFGKPLHCPKCPPSSFYGWLKLPGLKAPSCPNCGTALVGQPRKKGPRVMRG